MNKKHEQSIIDGTFNAFKRVAEKKHRNLIRCSMDGQDSIYGGDYLFTDNSKFILAEFKYEERDLSSEVKKPKRRVLCENLDVEKEYRKISNECHYIAWSVKKHVRKVMFNQYYDEICNNSVFKGYYNLIQESPNKSNRIPADAFFNDFLTNDIGANYFSFKRYTKWLYSLEKERAEDKVELIVDNPDKDQLEMLDFESLGHLKQWMDQTKIN